jgi:hypothetical protein
LLTHVFVCIYLWRVMRFGVFGTHEPMRRWQIEGGADAADAVAAEHGFDNLGQVGTAFFSHVLL